MVIQETQFVLAIISREKEYRKGNAKSNDLCFKTKRSFNSEADIAGQKNHHINKQYYTT